MSKLGVGVGDEFPAEQIHEIRTDEDGVVHHHHYYRRRRGSFLRVILWIMLVSALFRAVNYATRPDEWAWRDRDGAWRDGAWVWGGHAAWNPWLGFAGLIATIVIIAGVLWFTRCVYPRNPD